MRIVSLLASSTEIVCKLGFEDYLVGVSHECDFPETVKTLPACSKPKFNIEGTSREIDQRVKTVVRDSLSVYEVNADKLRELKPDVIVTQDHCEVCAVSLRDVENAVCDWLESKPRIVTLRPNALQDVWSGITMVAEALGAAEKGAEVVQSAQARMREIADKAQKLTEKPRVACVEWLDPLMAAGNWIPEFIHMLGGESLFGEPGKHSPWMSFSDLVKKDPDLIMVMPCGWDINRSLEEMHCLTGQQGWQDLRAVKEGRVYMTDGNQYFNRPGPRLVESLEIMAEVMYPQHFKFGHQGTGWEPFKTLA